MRTQTVMIVLLALTFGVIAAVGVMLLSKQKPAGGADRVTMVLAAADVPRGETLTADSLVAKEFPAGAILPGMITKLEDAIGRSTLTPLFKGEPLLDSKLAEKGAGKGLASLIKPGMRAMTIATPNVAMGVAGFILPGSRVDIHWTGAEGGPNNQASGAGPPLLENVEILAVDANIDAPTANRADAVHMKSVTIQVSPEEAGILTPALTKGTIYLSLRNPADKGRVPPRPQPQEVKAAPDVVDRGLAEHLEMGMRGISISAADIAGVAGFIKPGNRVDVHWTPKTSDRPIALNGAEALRSAESQQGVQAPQRLEIPLLENVKVLAVDEKLDTPTGNWKAAGPIRTVTLQVTPEEAGRLAPALSKGTIHLSLRNPSDDSVAFIPPPRVLRVIRGARPSLHMLGDSGRDAKPSRTTDDQLTNIGPAK